MKNTFGEDIPDKLYKYIPWRWIWDRKNNMYRNYTEDLILNNKFYLSPANTLNDPFDSAIEIRLDCDEKAYFEELIKITEEREHRKLSYKERESLKSNISLKDIAELKRDNYRLALEVVRAFREKIGITCFSKNGLEDPKNILMWSHYANNHNGLCLVFDTNFLWGKRLEQVKYYQEYPYFNYYEIKEKGDPTALNKAYTAKCNVWKYEGEYRILGNDGERLLHFEENSLIEVICGCNMHVVAIGDVIRTLKKRNVQVKLTQAVKKQRCFSLRKELIGSYGG